MNIQAITDDQLQQQLADHGQVVIKFYADWCGSCRLIAPKYKKMAENEAYAGVAFLEIDAEKNPNARAWAGVNNLPYFAVVKDGKLVEGDFTAKIEKVEEMVNGILA